MSYTPGRFVWFEHCSDDIPKARAFYEKLFGWNTELMSMPRFGPVSGDPQRRQRHRRLLAGARRLAAAVAVVPVGGDLDSAYKAALAAGAKSLMAPMDYGSAGRAATIADPSGGVFLALARRG